MHAFKFCAVGVFCAFVSGCATPPPKYFPPPSDYVPLDQIQIASRFDTVEVTPDTLGTEVVKCVPQMNPDSQGIKKVLQGFPSANINAFGHASSSRIFILHRTTGTCMQRSAAKFPIFAAEAFVGTVSPSGVPPDVVDGWYKQIAMQIARKGTAKVAFVFNNGNAFVANYWVEATADFSLYYSSAFRKAGTWETENFDARFSDSTLSSISETKTSGKAEKTYPFSHRSH
jgi:hypothetical protein